jgi:CDP-4-dehydro-6-deoxyglucose reductase
MALDMVASFHLYWIAPADGGHGHYQSNQCRAWTDALDNFQYTPLTVDSDEETQLKQALNQVVEDYPDLNGFEVYIAGTDSFVTVAQALLRQHHLPDSRCHLATLTQGNLE